MTTKEQYKTGILIAGMLIIAGALSYLQPDRHVAQSEAIPAYRPPPAPVQVPVPAAAPIVAAPLGPHYSAHRKIAINQNIWSKELKFHENVHIEWKSLEDDVWLESLVNETKKYRSFPLNDSRFKPLALHEDIRTLQFLVTPGTPVQTGTVEITVRKNTPGNFDAGESMLPPGISGLTASQVKAGPEWPSQLTPTRTVLLPPDGFRPGTQVSDTIFPIEDVFYRIGKGWTITPSADGGNQLIQAAPIFAGGTGGLSYIQSHNECVGVRIRPSNPDAPVVVHFDIVPAANQNQNRNPQQTGQPPYTSQGVSYGYPARPPPANRPFYPTSPTGPSYYPSHHNPYNQ